MTLSIKFTYIDYASRRIPPLQSLIPHLICSAARSLCVPNTLGRAWVKSGSIEGFIFGALLFAEQHVRCSSITHPKIQLKVQRSLADDFAFLYFCGKEARRRRRRLPSIIFFRIRSNNVFVGRIRDKWARLRLGRTDTNCAN